MKTKGIITCIIAVLAVVIIWLLIGQIKNEDGLIEVVIPVNLLGGETTEKFYHGYLTDFEYQKLVTDVRVNDEDSITLVLTTDQLTEYKQNMYNYGMFDGNNDSIKNVTYENKLLTRITVLVHSDKYEHNVFEKTMCNSVLAAYAGMYQVLSGIPPDEWSTTITIKDDDTDEIISVTEFPNDDMYRVY